MSAIWLCFAVSFLLCAYIYAGYPLMMWLLSRVRERRIDKGPSRPSMTLVIPVYNERDVLADKLENALSLDYGGTVEIIVISDGATDGSVEIARRYTTRGVRLCSCPAEAKRRRSTPATARSTRFAAPSTSPSRIRPRRTTSRSRRTWS